MCIHGKSDTDTSLIENLTLYFFYKGHLTLSFLKNGHWTLDPPSTPLFMNICFTYQCRNIDYGFGIALHKDLFKFIILTFNTNKIKHIVLAMYEYPIVYLF